MSTATNFIPNDAEIEVNEAYFQTDVKNFATNEEIETQSRGCVQDYEARFKGQRAPWDSTDTGIWNLQDAAWSSWLNDTAVQNQKFRGANEPDEWERAKLGSTLFYRQVRQKASNGYAVQTSKDMPFKYDSIRASEFDDAAIAEERANKLNLLAKWSMKNDNFNVKSIEFWTQVYKRGNIPVVVEWEQVMGKKKVSEPEIDADGNEVGREIREIDTAVVNKPTFQVLPVESLYADTAIGNIQDQECVIVSTVVSITEIVQGIRSGLYREDTLELLGRNHQWDGTSGGYDNDDQKKENRGFEERPTSQDTGQYLKREVFVNLPIDVDEETWDETANIPQRFRITMFGNQPSDAVVARIERNQEPDDAIPVEIIHANPDDSNLLYKISDFEVIQSDIAAETTILRQLIDNNTLTNKPPMVEVDGAVEGNDRAFSPDVRFKVENQGDITFLNIRDLSQSNIPVLQYVREDANMANSLDKNTMGESFGARTTASEATTISSNSRRPNIVNIEYILEQLFKFVAQRYKVNWEAYGRTDQIIQITDANDNKQFIKPTNLGGEYDIVVDVVDDMKEDEVKAQRLINGAQVFAGNPQLANQVDWEAMAHELSESIFGTDKFIVGQRDEDAIAIAKMNLALVMNGQQPTITPNMNLARHLEIYKEARQQYVGMEEQYPNVALLDSLIAQIEQMVQSQQQAGVQAQQQGLPQSQAQLQQQLTSGAIGGVQ
jgi:hypothetical protein